MSSSNDHIHSQVIYNLGLLYEAFTFIWYWLLAVFSTEEIMATVLLSLVTKAIGQGVCSEG